MHWHAHKYSDWPMTSPSDNTQPHIRNVQQVWQVDQLSSSPSFWWSAVNPRTLSPWREVRGKTGANLKPSWEFPPVPEAAEKLPIFIWFFCLSLGSQQGQPGSGRWSSHSPTDWGQPRRRCLHLMGFQVETTPGGPSSSSSGSLISSLLRGNSAPERRRSFQPTQKSFFSLSSSACLFLCFFFSFLFLAWRGKLVTATAAVTRSWVIILVNTSITFEGRKLRLPLRIDLFTTVFALWLFHLKTQSCS